MAELGSIGFLSSSDRFLAKRVSGVVLDDAGNPARRVVMSVTQLHKVLRVPMAIQSGMSDPVTGAYSLGCGFEDSVAVIAFDDDQAPSLNALILDKLVPT